MTSVIYNTQFPSVSKTFLLTTWNKKNTEAVSTNWHGKRKSPHTRLFLEDRDATPLLITITGSSFNQGREYAKSAVAFTECSLVWNAPYQWARQCNTEKAPSHHVPTSMRALYAEEQRVCSKVFRINKNLTRKVYCSLDFRWLTKATGSILSAFSFSAGYRKTSSGALSEIYPAEIAQYFFKLSSFSKSIRTSAYCLD